MSMPSTTPLPPPYNDRATVSTSSFRLPPPQSLPSSPSYSSNSSFGSLSFHDCDSPNNNNNNNNTSPAATPLQFQGVPFSWEQIPGIPKKSNIINNHPSLSLLPLPPAGTPCSDGPDRPAKSRKPVLIAAENSPKKINDPFFAAFVECSKDDHNCDYKSDIIWKSSNKVTRSISDRFGFISLYASCKSACAVSESIVYFPRSRNFDHLLNRRSRR